MEKYNVNATVEVNDTVKKYLNPEGKPSILKSTTVDGYVFPAKDVLCALWPFVITGLDALMELVTRAWLRWVIAWARDAVNNFVKSVCSTK